MLPEQIDNAIIAIGPREGEDTLRTEDILAAIEKEGDQVIWVRVEYIPSPKESNEMSEQIAVVWLSGVQYYTGQFFDIPPLCKKAHEKVDRQHNQVWLLHG